MITFDSAPVDVPLLSPWLRHQQEWWRTLTRLPSPPSRQREAHEPLSYDEAERLRMWRRETGDVIEQYEGYLKSEAGQQDLAHLDQSRQQALDCIAAVQAAERVEGGCRAGFLNARHFYDFLKETAQPGIALVKAELRLKLAEYERERATRPADSDVIGASEAYQGHYEARAKAVRDCESLLSSTYATHVEAVEMIAKAEAELARERLDRAVTRIGTN